MIVVDVGNTSLHFARINDEGEVIKNVKLPTSKANKSSIQKVLANIPDKHIVVCSVVPSVTAIFGRLSQKIYIIGKDIKVPIRCLYNNQQVGIDRLVGAFSVKTFFPKTRLVLDFGTAITMDILSKGGVYQGGLILPGIGSTVKALSQCALLPKLMKFEKIKKVIPRDTKESINKGLEEGFSLMINSLIEKYKNKLRISFADTTIITGGEVSVIIHKLEFPYQYEPSLVVKGIWALSNNFFR